MRSSQILSVPYASVGGMTPTTEGVDPWPVDTVTTYPLALSRRGDGRLTRAEGPRTLEQQELRERLDRRREQAIERAGAVWARWRHTISQMTPREQAEAAWSPTSRYTVDELEDLIRIERGLDPIHAKTGLKESADD
jgi:hypothetical protein